MTVDPAKLQTALGRLTQRLLAERVPAGHWAGRLSPSALSSATATIALTLASRRAKGHRGLDYQKLAEGGVGWLVANQNTDGGWGDTTKSLSNISTTSLCWAALTMAGEDRAELRLALSSAEGWLDQPAGSLRPAALCEAISRRYGKDRTFSVPILTVLALSGLLGGSKEAWSRVPQLPFELAAFPQSWYRWLRLPVVSYALPALIALGQARHRQLPSPNPLARLLRDRMVAPTMQVLQRIQPSSGGFLEATPLTSFVVMSLISAGHTEHPVVEGGLRFLEQSVRPNGSWPIDTNLATWVSTLSVNALFQCSNWRRLLDETERRCLRDWLLNQQYRQRDPYTGADPGGWAWTDLPGGVPDADDTSGALLALRALGRIDGEMRDAAAAGVRWLLDLQNSDGGVPTFCRGWGELPFDRSSPDLTAHAIRAWHAWRPDLLPDLAKRMDRATNRGITFLTHSQRPDGAWQPLWFGNQWAPDDMNLVYGTARVLQALAFLDLSPSAKKMTRKAAGWLVNSQNDDGGWGGVHDVPSSIEETSLAVSALSDLARKEKILGPREIDESISRGVGWLIRETAVGSREEPSPIGFYFAKLWYYEELYPKAFAIEALARAECSIRNS